MNEAATYRLWQENKILREQLRRCRIQLAAAQRSTWRTPNNTTPEQPPSPVCTQCAHAADELAYLHQSVATLKRSVRTGRRMLISQQAQWRAQQMQLQQQLQTTKAAHDACQEQLTQAQRALQQQQAHSAQTHHALDCAKHQVAHACEDMQQLSMAHQQTCQDLYAMQQQAVTLRTAVDLLHTLAGLPIPQQLTGEARWQVLMDVASACLKQHTLLSKPLEVLSNPSASALQLLQDLLQDAHQVLGSSCQQGGNLDVAVMVCIVADETIIAVHQQEQQRRHDAACTIQRWVRRWARRRALLREQATRAGGHPQFTAGARSRGGVHVAGRRLVGVATPAKPLAKQENPKRTKKQTQAGRRWN